MIFGIVCTIQDGKLDGKSGVERCSGLVPVNIADLYASAGISQSGYFGISFGSLMGSQNGQEG